ncbi:MAG: pyridoxamine 5-phosphate oxidase [Pseudomonadota bacterium]
MAQANPYRDLDAEARETIARLLATSTHAALGVIDPDHGGPAVSRIAFAWIDGAAITLISSLSDHTKALALDARCSLMIGTPAARGDPLTHPRLMLTAMATPQRKDDWRASYLALRPKAGLYVDFTDFQFLKFEISAATLNGGFGKAYRLATSDLRTV